MRTDRIEDVIDVPRMARSRACVVGTGGSAGLCRHLLRCGLGAIDLLDRDVVEDVNLCRQEHMADQAGLPKVSALAAELRRINPAAEIRTHHRDVTALPDAEADALFGGT